MLGTHHSRRQWIAAFFVTSVAALGVVLPWKYVGIPSGHDFEFHFNSWVEILDHWRQGVVYPHWAALAHYGYGEARFIFYPPLSWAIGGALSAILPWNLLPGAYVWFALTLSGMSMFVVARRWFSFSDALFAAVLYLANPYHLIIVYWRSAFAELLAAAYLPLLLLYASRLEEDGKRAIPPVAVLLALGWLTNIPSAVMMHYSLALFALYIAISSRRWGVIGLAGICVFAGAAVAAVYLLPVWHQKSWVSLDQVLSPGIRPQDNFLFARTTDADHDRFNLLISVVSSCEFALLGIALFVWRAQRLAKLWWPLMFWGTFCMLLMFSPTAGLWRHLPELEFVQFPWRWLLALNVVFGVAIVAAFRRWSLRVLLFALALGSVLVAGHRILRPWWDSAPDLKELVDNQRAGIGNEGADEYVPAGADPYDVNQTTPLVKYSGTGSAKITIAYWGAEHRVITALASAPGELVFKLFNYPDWKVTVNGRHEYPGMTKQHQISVPVQSGESEVDLRFVAGWDRRIGGAISLMSLFAIAVWYKKTTHSSATEANRSQ